MHINPKEGTMNKERKSEYFHFRLTPVIKQRLMERSLQLGKEPSEYLLSLIQKDLSSDDINENEKPKMKEFAQLIATEILSNMEIKLKESQSEIIKKTEHQTSILYWIYRLILYTFYNIGLRIKHTFKMQSEELKSIDDEASKNVNSSYDNFIKTASTENANLILEYLKKPI